MGRKFDGGVDKRPSSLRIRFEWQGALRRETLKLNGKPLPPTPANVKYALRVAADVRRAITAGTFDYAQFFPDAAYVKALAPVESAAVPANTFGLLADLWLRSQGRLAPGTRDGAATAVRLWKRIFGPDTPVSAIDNKVAASAIGGYAWPSPKTHNNYMIALRGIMALEYHGARAGENPISDISNMEVPKTKPDPLSRGERDLILADMKERYDPRVHAYFVWMFFTGMRPEEAIALRWSDIDFSGCTARVQRVRTFRGSERRGTKTFVDRDVDLVPEAMAALKVMKAYTFMKSAERLGLDRDDTSRDIFERPEYTGGPHGGQHYPAAPWHDERRQRELYWKPTLKRLGIRARRAYCTRHTYCTVALMGGVPPAYIALQAGHSLAVLLSTYAKWIPGADGGEVQKMLARAMRGADKTQIEPRKAPDDSKSLIRIDRGGRSDRIRTK